MKTAGFALLVAIVCIGPAVAQRGDSYSDRNYRGPAGPVSGVSPYGPARGPVPMSRPGGASTYQSQPIPSTRFAPVPDSAARSTPPAGPSMYRSQGMSPYATAPGYSPSPASSRMQPESGRVRSRAEDLQRMSPEMKAEDRLKVPLLKSMYRQGNDMLDEGRNSNDESKIKMGIQQINEANERVNRLEREYGPDNSPAGERNDRGNNGRSNGRRDRR